MTTIQTSTPPSPSGPPRITWLSAPIWLARTCGADLRTYRRRKRAHSVQRLLGNVFANLSQPIFILGAPRSGTTFLGSCLAALPEVSYHFEPIATKAAVRYVFDRHWETDRARRFFRRVYARLMQIHLDGDLRFAEKTPRNCFIVPFLHHSFPAAKFLHVIRDGRDVALSLSKKPWFQGAATTSRPASSGQDPYGSFARFWVEPDRTAEFETVTTMRRCAWTWRRHVESVLAAAKGLPTGQYQEIRYEDLVSGRPGVAAEILQFLDISDPDSVERFERELSSASADSVGRWQRELSSDDIEDILREAEDCLRCLGYVTPPRSGHGTTVGSDV